MTQAETELQALLQAAEDYRRRNGLSAVTVTAVGVGGHAYANRGAQRIDATIGKWKKETPAEDTGESK